MLDRFLTHLWLGSSRLSAPGAGSVSPMTQVEGEAVPAEAGAELL